MSSPPSNSEPDTLIATLPPPDADDDDLPEDADNDDDDDVSDVSDVSAKNWFDALSNPPQLVGYQKLVTDESVKKWSLYALRFGIFADAVTSTILQPNYAIMARSGAGADDEVFDSTSPFDFNAATYFIPMTALLGVSISSFFTGRLSDKYGRKPVLQVCMGGSVIGTALKWILRETFWGFCGANFFNGLLSGGLPVALAYLGDVFTTYEDKAPEFGLIVGFYVLGNSFGGVIAILMQAQGLFAPLWVGVALMFCAFWIITRYLVEAGDLKLLPSHPTTNAKEDQEETNDAPKTINNKVMWNIIIGAFVDNVGSNGLFPLCLSPLAFNQFYSNFVDEGLEPVLKLTGYKWVSVLVALMVIPSTAITPRIFNKIGPAGGCVFGNIMTAIVTLALLFLGSAQATTGFLAGFIVVMYTGFPFTVVSQLSTGPMLDAIAPLELRGYVQGLNSTVMNVATALAPWLLGILADATTTSIAIYTGFAISIVAALVNFPLIYQPGMGPPPKREEFEHKAMDWEDSDVVERCLAGDYVPGAVLDKLNEKRVQMGLPYILAKLQTYEHDKENLDELRREAGQDFVYARNRYHWYLSQIAGQRNDPNLGPKLEAEIAKTNRSVAMLDGKEVDDVYDDLGRWFAAYMRDAGYYAHLNQILVKQIILTAFPVITEDTELSLENLEQFIANSEQVYGHYVHVAEDKGFSLQSVLETRSTRTLYG